MMMAAWDCRITQVVDVNKGIHCFSAKSAKAARKIEALPDQENKTYLVTVGQGRRPQQGDGRRVVGDDRAAAERKEAEPARRVQPRQHGDGLPSGRADGAVKAVHCLVPKSTWVASR